METKNIKQIDVESWICEHQKLLIAIVRRYAPIRGRTVNAEKAKDGVLWTMRDLLMDKDTYSADYDQTEWDDFFQIACIGVLSAAKTYLPEKGASFSTYAYRCAKNAILMEARKWNCQKRQISYCFSEARWVLSSRYGGYSSEDDFCFGEDERKTFELALIDTTCSSQKRLFPDASIPLDIQKTVENKEFLTNLLSYARSVHKFLPDILLDLLQGISFRETDKRLGCPLLTAEKIWFRNLGKIQKWLTNWIAENHL